MRKLVVFLGMMVALLAMAQTRKELSADMVITPKGDKGDMPAQQGKLYLGRDKLRTEMPTPHGTMAYIHETHGEKSIMLMVDRKTAVEMGGPIIGLKAPRHSSPERLLAGPDGNPCGMKNAGKVCTKLGSERVNGRDTAKWRMTEASGGGAATLWVDNELGIVVKMDSAGAATELTNIKVGPQPASLFEIPKDFQVMKARSASRDGMPPGGPGK
jgi:hypothetical protein